MFEFTDQHGARATAVAALDALFDRCQPRGWRGDAVARRQPRPPRAVSKRDFLFGSRRETTVGLEGELRVGLRVRDAQIDRIGITSTRPDVARSLLQGRTRAEVVAAVPRLFSICGHSQAAASAAGLRRRGRRSAERRRCWRAAPHRCDAEMVREYAWRTAARRAALDRREPHRRSDRRRARLARLSDAGAGRVACRRRRPPHRARGLRHAGRRLARPALAARPGPLGRCRPHRHRALDPPAARRRRRRRPGSASCRDDGTARRRSATRRGSASCPQPAMPTPNSPACRPGAVHPPRPVRWRGCTPSR